MLVEMYETNLIVRVAEIMDICAGMRGVVISVIRTRALGGGSGSGSGSDHFQKLPVWERIRERFFKNIYIFYIF